MQVRQKPVRFAVELSSAEYIGICWAIRNVLHGEGDPHKYGLRKMLEKLEPYEEIAAESL